MFPSPSNVHRALATAREYEKRYTASRARFDTDDALAADLIARARQLRPATVRQYRAAYVHVWERLGRDDLIDAVSVLSGSKDAAMPMRTSSTKAKAFKLEEMGRLIEALKARGHVLAAVWLRSTYIAGLRPSEWPGARLNGIRLVVQNGKNSNGRSHGDTRTLHLLCGLVDIENMGWLIAALQLGYETRYAQVRQAVYRESRRLWPRRSKLPTLYTARHMFAAVAKTTMTREEVGAVMGHADARTAGAHYARRSSAGGRRPAVRADRADVVRVAPAPARAPAQSADPARTEHPRPTHR